MRNKRLHHCNYRREDRERMSRLCDAILGMGLRRPLGWIILTLSQLKRKLPRMRIFAVDEHALIHTFHKVHTIAVNRRLSRGEGRWCGGRHKRSMKVGETHPRRRPRIRFVERFVERPAMFAEGLHIRI